MLFGYRKFTAYISKKVLLAEVHRIGIPLLAYFELYLEYHYYCEVVAYRFQYVCNYGLNFTCICIVSFLYLWIYVRKYLVTK